MIALARFQIAGYLRSLRILQPLLVVLLIVALVLLQRPSHPDPEGLRELATGTLGDVAAFMFPIWAWAARALLDTQPDGQRDLSATAVRHRGAPVAAGLLAAYTVNLVLGVVALAVPFVYGALAGVGAPALLAGVGLMLLAAASATALGAWTSRPVIPSPGTGLLVLLSVLLAVLLLGIGPLSPLTVPMLDWIRAAHAGPVAFTDAYGGIALRLALWTALVGVGYALVGRRR
ncbi:hypothetical protein [Actinomadura hibisca]|uniref:hypothetical protein n=1 Tax=Actinomadura hibisca TaxID=68565 RepID=UPI00082D4CDF|nr:hypothetical protein [Actinomadura hibisca]